MTIPFIDLQAQYQSIKSEVDRAVLGVMAEGDFISPKYLGNFEEEFAAYIGTDHCITCGNGTDAMEILLKAMDIGEGDEVIVPAVSWISTSSAVSALGAKPVFVDIDSQLYTLDLNAIEEKITEQTKAIIPVHLYGQPVDMPRLMELANKHGLKVLEDCAQAHGASINGRKVGTFGHCSSFSFYPTKNLGAYGDAGAMLTNDPEIAEKARIIANCGQKGRHQHVIEGRTSRMSSINAAVLSIKLTHLDRWNSIRIEHASSYQKLLENSSITLPKVAEGGKHVYHIYGIQAENRENLLQKLEKAGIGYSIHYPTPLPLLPCYGKEGYQAKQFPVASRLAKHAVSLPMHESLTEEMLQQVASIISIN